MGGSFNPPHDGHLLVASIAMKRLRLDRLWWLVTPGNPLKDHQELAPLAERMAACRRLIGARRGMLVTGFEALLGSAYTAATVRFLNRRYPATRFVWVMGADSLAQLHRWQRWRDIAAGLPIVAVDRPGWRYKALASRAARVLRPQHDLAGHPAALRGPRQLIYVSAGLSHASSTQLRAPCRR